MPHKAIRSFLDIYRHGIPDGARINDQHDAIDHVVALGAFFFVRLLLLGDGVIAGWLMCLSVLQLPMHIPQRPRSLLA